MSADALSVLREVHERTDPDLPFDLVETCYRIEQRSQYERDPDVRINGLRAAVTIAVEEDMRRDEGEDL